MDKIIFYLILVLLPFGQLFKFGLVNIFDLAVLLLGFITLFQKPKFPSWYKYFFYFVLSCIFSLLVKYQFIDYKSVLYLVRLVSYSLVAVYVGSHANDKKYKVLLGYQELNSKLVALSVVSAIFGWLQYIFWPDLTALKYLGWDDHLLRMVGTFFDPTYLALIFILGIILSIKNKNTKSMYFLIFSLAFTYSRISYLILLALLAYKKKYLGLIVFALVIFILPKNIGEGTTLTRTASGNNKIINYQETMKIVKNNPIFGVGFNSICNVKMKYFDNSMSSYDSSLVSHSCSGADSSLLFLLATTGIVGVILFANFILNIPSGAVVVLSFVAVLIHSLFSNSMFYPHIMFWMFALIGSETKSDS